MGYVYEDITAEQRAQIGMIAAMGRGAYGMVTKLAQELGTSRKFVYGLADKVRRAVLEAVQPMEPGPKAVSLSLEVDRRLLDRAIVGQDDVLTFSEPVVVSFLPTGICTPIRFYLNHRQALESWRTVRLNPLTGRCTIAKGQQQPEEYEARVTKATGRRR